MKPTGRVVAIVGRPNVGKSAIFNRLTRSRTAIVHSLSGVTRDRIVRRVQWEGEPFDLIDTGGVVNQDRAALPDTIESGTRSQVDAAVADAAVVIFAVDATSGALPLDFEAAGLLRRSGRPVVVAANKADHAGLDAAAAEFEAFGFPVYPVSALHDRGFDELMAAVMRLLPEKAEPAPAPPPALRVAIVGRPNVGKSSYVNRLLRSDRVIVSSVPGTTRDSIDIPFSVGAGEGARHYVLVDTAGIRRQSKVDTPVERFSLLRAERSIEGADVVVLVLDGAQGPTSQDKKIADSIREARRGRLLLVNKWDLLPPGAEREYQEALVRVVPFLRDWPVVFVSTKTGHNIRRSVEAIDRVATQVQADLPTGPLNRVLKDAYERVSPPAPGGRRLKLFYATQVGKAPVRIRIFVNHAKEVPPAYEQYLLKAIRQHFGLEGAPVVLQFRSRRSEEDVGAGEGVD